jgi:hypothetical protein
MTMCIHRGPNRPLEPGDPCENEALPGEDYCAEHIDDPDAIADEALKNWKEDQL